MNQGSKPGAALAEQFACPLLLECDSEGKVLWVSSRGRQVLGSPATLSDLVLVKRPSADPAAPQFRVYSWHFWRVWEFRDTVVIGVRPPQLPDRTYLEVLRMEGRLLRSFLRLVRGERRLTERVGRRRGSNGGHKAIRQIELERQRLGRELHTGIGQNLAAIRLQLEIIGSEIPLPPPGVMHALESISRLVSDSLTLVRGISRRLHPPEWQRLTLEEAMCQLWDLSGIPRRFEGALRIEPLARDPDPEIKALLYRITQEALSNIVRHSRATRIEAELRPDGNRIVLRFSDNGIGFDLNALRSAPASVSAGIGLRSIRDLVAEAGGNFDMESGPNGTTLVVSVGNTPD